MKNKKNIIIASTLAILAIGISSANADTNSLLQMDVKRSSISDTVDVTFYTTAASGNSVVTRKSGNKYVVLLPNTSSTSSVAPNFGGVKDLITDIDVKHVNDGMGGYTKVTFGTTKPINIKTHMSKTAPISQAQKEARELIARNAAATAAVKPVTNTKPTTSNTVTSTTKPAITPVVKQPAAAAKNSTSITTDTSKIKIAAAPVKIEKKVEQTKPVQRPQQTAAKPNVTAPAAQSNNYVPKMKFDNNGKRVIDLEPRVSHSVVNDSKPNNIVNEEPVINETYPQVQEEIQTTPTAIDTPISDSSSSDFPYWILYAGGSLAVLCIIFLAYDAAKHSEQRSKSRLESFYDVSVQNQVKRRKKEYYEIINNNEISWQEKYKLYNEKGNMNKPAKHSAAMSYVTDISGLKQPKQLQNSKVEQISPELMEESNHKKIVNEKMKAKMLELEKSYKSPSAQKEETTTKVHSEDDVILKSFNDIKLKSFSKPMSLKETQRPLIQKENNNTRNKSYQEGRFVKIKSAPKNISVKKDLATSDLINTGDKYLQNKGNIKMSKVNENYLLSSLDEYLTILDTESPMLQPMPSPKVQTPTSEAMSRSGVSNPIASAKTRMPQTHNMPLQNTGGLVVKSGYNIDMEKGFYVVDVDGVSAIVGRIKENIFVLKKFNKVIDSTIQVRRDDENIYIVRLGKFKCLVNVENDKMGTLIEI